MKSILAIAAAVAAVLLLSSCSNQPAAPSASSSSTTAAAQAAAFNQADVDFATMMIPHHQQAVDLAAMVPSRSTNADVLKLAADISAAQGPEIQTMKAFLVQWNAGGQERSDSGNDTGEDQHQGHDMAGMAMDGMVDQPTMTKLESLNGAAFDTLWLQSMIGHHEGAIKMAQTELANGTNADAKTLAQQIITGQQAEITQMKQMLGG
jgi:uncharacterized protein (DUF305 family)